MAGTGRDPLDLAMEWRAAGAEAPAPQTPPAGGGASPLRGREAWAEALGSRFLLAAEGGGLLPLTLTEVRPEPPLAGYEQFSALFLGPAAFVLPQRTYALRHEGLGALALFLVPVGRDAAGTRYEAVFSRALPQG